MPRVLSRAGPSQLLGLRFEDAERLARGVPTGAGFVKQLYAEAFRAARFCPEDLPIRSASIDAYRELFALELPVVKRTLEEPSEGPSTVKVVLGLADGLEVEAVRIPMGPDKTTLCVSSQVGCKMACAFCETGRMGLVRSLDAHEIVAQLVVARAVLGWPVKNVVFMGMGEALDNRSAVFRALEIFRDRRGLSLSQSNITVCTAGHVEGLDELRALGLRRLGVSLSLNAARDELRAELMPLNRKWPLAEVQAALLRYRAFAPRLAFAINYCLLPGLNDSERDIAGIAEFCQPLGKLMVNVIPFNPGTAPLTRAPTEEEVSAFLDRIAQKGLPVRRRITRGRSVMAACGQLGNVELRGARRGIRAVVS
ncbi:MAG: radical SAM protein [Deltaproteobacteria bacterium]|nr:radical SAM protein [Deltaproteobacteria bacterium]